ncbi:superoxide dismutase family protein [Lysobacter firmicutimachus]|uniref:Superoxide dismutase [Cu-Zn] n=1 Tax=Lysobacter firmicutimachus TaxID=1792846 RepID=A0AAU8MTY1_9GAMM
MSQILRSASIVAALGVAACSGQASRPAPAPSATVEMMPASGSRVSGKLVVRPKGDRMYVSGEIAGLEPGSTHAIHIHEKGDCSAADASSAGGHFNPAGQPHGQVEHGAHHAGDMNNLVADAKGVAKVEAYASGVALGGGAADDIAGRAVIVHAAPDDYKSQPTGNAGARQACGVIELAL